MRKIVSILVGTLVLLTGFTSCIQSSTAKAPEISISAYGNKIQYAVMSANVSEHVLFDQLLQGYGGRQKLPCILLGEFGGPIEIVFDRLPDQYTVMDFIISEDGNLSNVWEDGTIPSDLVNIKDNMLLVPLEPRAPLITGVMPEPGSIVRGFVLECQWGTQKYNYAFILRTDALLTQTIDRVVTEAESAYNGEVFPHGSTVLNFNDFSHRETPIPKAILNDAASSLAQIFSYSSTIDFTFPEDGLPDTVEVMNDVLPLNGAVYEYQGDTRSLPLSELTMKDGKLSFIVKPEYFAEGEQNCNVTYVLCTWDGLTSVYTVIFRINP